MPNRTASLVLALAIFAAVGVILLGPVAGVVADNTGTQAVTNETVNADYNQSVDLRGYDIDENSETVWGFNDTSGNYEQAVSGTDYSMNYGEGSVDFLSGSTLIEDAEETKVTYDYRAADPITTLIIGFVPLGVGLLIFVVVAQKTTEVL